jgi:hypothetical protein
VRQLSLIVPKWKRTAEIGERDEAFFEWAHRLIVGVAWRALVDGAGGQEPIRK